MNSTEDMKSTEVAVLLDNNVNKYNPGIQTFRLQSTGGLQSNTRGVYQQGISTNNLLNEDKSFVTGFDYETSIDDNVYTQIKLYRDNQTSGKREVFIVNDTVNGGDKLKRWGILQLYEKIDESYNLAQIESRALKMLKYYCDTRRSLTLHCLGVKEFFAGCTFKCKIADLGDLSLNSYLLVTQCTHKFKNNEHTMDLETEVVRGG